VKDVKHNLEMLPDSDPKQKEQKEDALAQWQTTLQQLSTNPPVGRVDIRIGSDIHRWQNTNADVSVRAGDTLTIPRRPSYVMVTGQVFNPTAVSYRPGKSAKWYLSESGGPTPMANKKAIFVIRADGSVIGERRSMWIGESLSAELQPGDTVVVPERAAPIAGVQWQSIFSAGQFASAVATTVVFALHY
jgi:polysaccharide biosynthesis/export protein